MFLFPWGEDTEPTTDRAGLANAKLVRAALFFQRVQYRTAQTKGKTGTYLNLDLLLELFCRAYNKNQLFVQPRALLTGVPLHGRPSLLLLPLGNKVWILCAPTPIAGNSVRISFERTYTIRDVIKHSGDAVRHTGLAVV